jgi:hypothetical protein
MQYINTLWSEAVRSTDTHDWWKTPTVALVSFCRWAFRVLDRWVF